MNRIPAAKNCLVSRISICVMLVWAVCAIGVDSYISLDVQNELSAIEGTEVTLSCTLPSDTRTLISFFWQRGANKETVIAYWDTSQTDPVNEPGFPADEYIMTIDTSTVKSDLTIKSINFDDESVYWCGTTFIPTPYGGNPEANISITVAAIESTEVALFCTLPSDEGTLLYFVWRRGDDNIARWEIGNTDPVNEPGFPADEYTMTIDTSTVESSLTIKSIDLDDEAVYWCGSSYIPTPAGGNPGRNMLISVTVPPEELTINTEYTKLATGEVVEVFNGSRSIFSCASKGSKPEVDISWTIGGNSVIPTPPTIPEPNDDDARLVDTTSSYDYEALWDHHNSNLECTVTNIALPSGMSTHVTIDVKVPPTHSTVRLYDSNPYGGKGSGAVREGTQHTFHCDVMGTRPEAQIIWRKGDEMLTGTIRREQDGGLTNSFGSLTFRPNRADHHQTFRCEASIAASGTVTIVEELTLEVYGHPDDPELNFPSNIREDERIQLTCSAANAYPGGSFVWYQDSTKVREDGRNELNLDNRYNIIDTFTLKTNRSINGDVIKCETRHETLSGQPFPADFGAFDVKFCSEVIQVTSCPDVEVGMKATLGCLSSSSNPANTLMWKESDATQPDTDQPTTTPAEFGGVTTFLAFETRDIERSDYNSVSYKCCGDNVMAACDELCSAPCNLNVRYPAENVVIDKSVQGPVMETDQITLDCSGDGNPELYEFTWLQDGSEIVREMTDSLHFESVHRDDAGFYRCVAGNGLSKTGLSPLVNVTIYFPTNITNKNEKGKQIGSGEDVIIDCIAIGLPRPEFNWTDSYGKEIVNREKMTVEEIVLEEDGVHGTVVRSQLAITDITDTLYGNYRCEARNTAGPPDSVSINLSGTTVPATVRSLEVIDTTKTTIIVSWTPGNSGGEYLTQWFVVDFRFHTEEGPEPWTKEHQVEGDKTNFTANDLEPGSMYEIRVFSENVIGRSYNSQTVKGMTKISVPTPVKHDVDIGVVVGIIIGVVVFLTFVAVIVILLYQNHSLRHRLQGSSENYELDEEPAKKGKNSHFNRVDVEQNEQQPDGSYVNYLLKQFKFPRENLRTETELGHGEFGRVLLGVATGISSGEKETKVAVKTLKDNANDEAKQLLTKEFNMMTALMPALIKQNNRNVVRLLGGCMEKDPLYMILEYVKLGDLKNLLRTTRTVGEGTYSNLFAGSSKFTSEQLIGFARQVANGMAFLAGQKCIHRDLAARNILLDEDYVCKVSDFGLAEDVMNIDVFRRQNQCRLPIRWMAIESVVGDVHTTESDVWSFGVLLWEIVTLGSRPYPGMKGGDIRNLLKTGYRMPQPKHCSEQLYNIMSVCWEKEPSKRPSFEKLMMLLDNMLEGEAGYLTLDEFETKLYDDVSIPAPNEKV